MSKLSPFLLGLILVFSTGFIYNPANDDRSDAKHNTIHTTRTGLVKHTPYTMYNTLGDSTLQAKVFEKAYAGFSYMQDQDLIKKNILTIIDYELPSTETRLWIIDLDSMRVLHNELVAHGMNSGENYATKFSNVPQSYMSSLGFYTTGRTYQGKHGLSLYLNGVEPGINDKARERAIVMHGADYVSTTFIEKYGRLGRSFGCPAVSYQSHQAIINTIAYSTCVFIHGNSSKYNDLSKIPGANNIKVAHAMGQLIQK